MKDLKLKVKNMCEFNHGKGSVSLYFTKKELRELKKLGINEAHTIKDAYNILITN